MQQPKPFKKVMVINRGEIALRILRTLKELGIESYLVYSSEDKQSLTHRLADYSVPLQGKSLQETFLNFDQLIKIIQETQVDGIHPGYGFLSENHHFVSRLENETQARFIGPKAKTLALMGDKIRAKEMMKAQGIPIVPGSLKPIESIKELHEIAKETGFPLMLKAAMGGGGRGIRVVHKDEELESSFTSCQREAQSYFNDDRVFAEKFIANPRHIEFQILFDTLGNGVHIFERDCSIQRRQQKLFEEAPSTFLNPSQRAHLGELAVKIGRVIGYQGLGTVEFICASPEEVYFMEMNPRIQVEHPVTELISGLDLVQEQIQALEGSPLLFKQDDLSINGWGMEARINAENPFQDFSPESGLIEHLHLPGGPFTRCDSHIYEGDQVSTSFDSMLCKLLTWGQDRDKAIKRMERALWEFSLKGFFTTAPFHQWLLKQQDFVDGNFDTSFLKNHNITQPELTYSPEELVAIQNLLPQFTERSRY